MQSVCIRQDKERTDKIEMGLQADRKTYTVRGDHRLDCWTERPLSAQRNKLFMKRARGGPESKDESVRGIRL